MNPTVDTMTQKPLVQRQGTIICEWSKDAGCWLIMFPTGEIDHRVNKRDAERLCKRWLWIHNDQTKIGIATIEWRKP
jgi:hypothetical protein